MINGIYRTQETPFRIGKTKVFRLFDLNGNFVGFRRKMTNKEIRKKKVNKDSVWIEVEEHELR